MPIVLAATQSKRLHPQKVQVIDDVHDPARLASAYEAFKRYSIPDGLFWFEIEKLHRHRAGDPAPVEELRQYLGDVASFVYDHFVKLLDLIPGADRDQVMAIEFWMKSVRPGQRVVGLHIDSAYAVKADEAKHPIWGTILHVGPTSRIEGGETGLCLEEPIPAEILRRSHTGCGAAEARTLSADWIEVAQKANRVVVFRGSLPHYVGPVTALSDPADARVSILANLWDHIPPFPGGLSGPCALVTAEDFAIVKNLDDAAQLALGRLSEAFDDDKALRAIQIMRRLW